MALTFLTETVFTMTPEVTSPSAFDMTSHLANTTLPEDYVMSTMDIVFVTVVSVTAILSIPSCVIIVVMYVTIRSMRTTGRAMLVQLTIADFLTASGNLLGVMWYLFR